MAKRRKPIINTARVVNHAAHGVEDKAVHAPDRPPESESSRSMLGILRTYSIVIAATLAFACVALQPISSELTWWQLSCGRQAIAETSLWPTADLLINESQGESNAIGAVLATTIYLLLGASGWMLVRVAAVIVAIFFAVFYWRFWRRDDSTAGQKLPLQLAFLSLSLAALSPYLDPVPILFDVVATAGVTVWLLGRDCERPTCNRTHIFSLAILFFFWANFGNHVFVGFLMVAAAGLGGFSGLTTTETSKPRFCLVWSFFAAAFSAMINPIGWRVWWDSFSQTVPWAIAAPWTLGGTDWAPLTQVTWGLSHFVFLFLTLLTLIPLLFPSKQNRYFAVTVVVQFLAWTSVVNIPLAIVWMTIQLLASTRHWALSYAQSQKFISIVAMIIISAMMIRTVGWGFNADLDPRMLEIAIAGTKDTGTILTDDSRSTGMTAWVLGPVKRNGSDQISLTRLQDEPRRALIGGRLLEHRRLFSDLRDSQQMSYWREDESQGGWWLPLTQRATSLLVCSRRDLKLIRRLEPTIWKPVSLDSPVLPYARAGDPIHTPKIVELLGQRDFINSGMWDYQPPQSTGSAYDRDRFGLFPARQQPDQTFDQADVFAAMELQIAALEVLDYARQQWSRHARYLPAWQRCQIELEDWERTSVGQASLMRTLASGKYSDADDLIKNFRLTQTEFGQWERLIAVYREEGAGAALQACEVVTQGITPEGWKAIDHSAREQLHYAAVCWAIESGRRDDAMRWTAALKVDRKISMVVRLLAQHQWVAQGWIDESQADSQETVR